MIQDARQFSLLTSQPHTQISSASLTPEPFSLRSALFILSVADNRDVTWQCRISTTGTWDGGKVSGMTTVPAAGSTGASVWQPCTTPQVHIPLSQQHVTTQPWYSTYTRHLRPFKLVCPCLHATLHRISRQIHALDLACDLHELNWPVDSGCLQLLCLRLPDAQHCTMQEYLSLPAGTLTFQAQATDLAGNVEASTGDSDNTKTWGPGVTPLTTPYAIITGDNLH